MDDEEAHVVATHYRYKRAAEERAKNMEYARKTNKRIMGDKLLVKEVKKELLTDKSMKSVARKFGIPHFAVIHIWRSNDV